MINGNNMYIQTAGMNIRKDNDDWRRAVDTVDAAETTILTEKTITENGTYTAAEDNADGYSKVTVDVSGGGSLSDDVVFYDYDGSVVASYSAADFANLSTMPANPSHDGLTAQGWNWSLAEAKSYVAAYGKLNIGQMYITSDGKTRFYYFIPKDNLTINLEFYLDTGAELNVDWGDGSEYTTWTDEDTSKSHTYQADGEYTVTISAVSGTYSLSHSWETDKTLRKVEIGSGVTSITALNQYAALTAISIPNTVLGISDNAFSNCSALCYITIPSGVDMLCEGSFTSCSALTAISIPNSVNWFDTGALFKCYSLKAVFIPPAVTNLGTGTFSYCYALTSIIIPSNITTIGSTPFQDCHALTSITFEPATPPELDGELGIPTTCIIRVPQGSLSAYTSASNYPDPSLYIYEEY